MKAIMISIKPKWCADIMNGYKTIEVRKNKALASAIQKIVDENGYADIYVYCSKNNKKHHHLIKVMDIMTEKTEYESDFYISNSDYLDYCYDCKVAFKFHCYKVEKFPYISDEYDKLIGSCLSEKELLDYSTEKFENGIRFVKTIYAIHISDLEIFDKPKKLKEFWTVGKHCKHKNKPDKDMYCDFCYHYDCIGNNFTKAPQNFYYVEVE